MKINIFGSTGIIGRKSLNIIQKNFPKLTINLLCANENINLLTDQIKKYKPKYVYINNPKKLKKLKLSLSKNLKFYLTMSSLITY